MENAIFTKLTDLHENTRVLLRSFSNPEVGSRLMSMGLLPGAMLEIKRIAPFKGGYCLKTNQQTIALRYSEAAALMVSQLTTDSKPAMH